MKVLRENHQYELANFENKGQPGQVLQFIEKAKAEDGSLKTINDGTTNEQVLEMLIDRTKGLNEKFPCRENSLAITHMEEALMWLEKRTADTVKRGVEGTYNK